MHIIDWKKVSKSPGYKSLKATYIHDVQTNQRNKKELYALFTWVISRAKHYSIKQNRPLEDVLNEWESKRNMWWLNYYRNDKQPKIYKYPSGKINPLSRNSHYYKLLKPRQKLEYLRDQRKRAK